MKFLKICVKALMKFGGIYLDQHVIVIKSLDPLRKFEMTLDYEFYKTYKVTSKKARSRTGKVFFNCILTINGINKFASKLKRFIL